MIGCLILPYFYAEAEVQRRPRLAGRPLAVHARGRITALSPAAEEAGLCQGMPLGQACMVSPAAEFLPHDQDCYQAAHRRVLEVCAEWVAAIEPLCLHELLLDLAGAGPPSEAAAMIAAAVHRRVGFTCQVGAASSKLVARIAAQERGVIVPSGQEAQFLAPLPLSRLWLLEGDDLEHLQALGITTIGLLQGLSQAHLAQRFGRDAYRVSRLARGLDDSPVNPVYPPRVVEARLAAPEGIGAETLDHCLGRLAAEMAEKLRARRQACCRLALQVEPECGRQVARTLKLRSPAATESEIMLGCRRLLERMELAPPLNAIAIQASDLRRCTSVQYDLFSLSRAPGAAKAPEGRRRALEALAAAQEHFGQAVMLGAQVEVPRRERMLAALAQD